MVDIGARLDKEVDRFVFAIPDCVVERGLAIEVNEVEFSSVLH